MLTPSPASDDIGIGPFLAGNDAGARFGPGGCDEGFVLFGEAEAPPAERE